VNISPPEGFALDNNRNNRKVRLRIANYTVGYFIGSLSVDSINRTLSKALIRLAHSRISHRR
jgi:hypothetical protein